MDIVQNRGCHAGSTSTYISQETSEETSEREDDAASDLVSNLRHQSVSISTELQLYLTARIFVPRPPDEAVYVP